MTYEVHKVSDSEYQVIDSGSNTEMCLCSEYDGETLSAQKRAYKVAKALSVAHCPTKKKGGKP